MVDDGLHNSAWPTLCCIVSSRPPQTGEAGQNFTSQSACSRGRGVSSVNASLGPCLLFVRSHRICLSLCFKHVEGNATIGSGHSCLHSAVSSSSRVCRRMGLEFTTTVFGNFHPGPEGCKAAGVASLLGLSHDGAPGVGPGPRTLRWLRGVDESPMSSVSSCPSTP